MTTFRSITLVIAVLLLAGGALTGIHLLNTNATAPLPAQLSTPDAGGGQGAVVPPVEQVPAAPGAPQTGAGAAGPAGGGTAPGSGATGGGPAPAQHPATTVPDRSSGSTNGHDSDSYGSDSGSGPGANSTPDRWHGGSNQWRDPDGFPRRDGYPFRDRSPGFGGGSQAPGRSAGQAGPTPTERDRARQQVAYALCDRYHLPRERCQVEPTGR